MKPNILSIELFSSQIKCVRRAKVKKKKQHKIILYGYIIIFYVTQFKEKCIEYPLLQRVRQIPSQNPYPINKFHKRSSATPLAHKNLSTTNYIPFIKFSRIDEINGCMNRATSKGICDEPPNFSLSFATMYGTRSITVGMRLWQT